MNALKLAAICFIQVILGPCAGPVGLASFVVISASIYLTWGKPVVGFFWALWWGHVVGGVVGAVVWYERWKRSADLK